MWPPSPSASKRPLPTGTRLGVDWSFDQLRDIGAVLMAIDIAPKATREVLAKQGIDPSRADELAAAYRLAGTAGLAQALEAARMKP